MPSSRGVALSVSLEDTEVAPGSFVQGEVKVKVDASHKSGVVYEAIRLVFLAVEKSCVWDDQGEFDALLNQYTSSRVYLDRHVTLAGFKTQTEDGETTAQVREEMLFLQHCTTPYASVAPTKPKRDAYNHYTREQFLRGGIPMAATTTLTTGGGGGEGAPGESVGRQEPVVGGGAAGAAGPAATSAARPEEVEFPVLMPGTHRFPFRFRLPPWLPPSFYYAFVGARGQLDYTASATMLFPGNGAGSWRFEFGREVRDAKRDAEVAFQRAADAADRHRGPHPHHHHDDGHGDDEGGIDVGDDVVGERTQRRLTSLPLYGPSDLVCKSRIDVLSVMPRRQLVAEYYQIDSHNIHQRPANAPRGPDAAADDSVKKSRRRTEKGESVARSLSAAVGVPEQHEDTHLALSALYQTFRCGFLGNMCCLQPQNALEAEVLVVGARTVLLADDLGASKALGVRPPSASAYPRLGAPAFAPDLPAAASGVPWPVSGLTLRVRVRNYCPKHTVTCVRVELKVMVEIFKSLKTPHTFPGISYSSFDYTTPIPPGNQALFDVRLGLTPRFRRHESDSHSLLPPPGVRTANMTSCTFLQVSFPGMETYIEEKEETKGVVILAETVDLNDDVLELPVRYS